VSRAVRATARRDGDPSAPTDVAAATLARYYDLDLLDDPGDLELYQALARRVDGPILELGAGTGRIAVPLAASGHEVTALDLDPKMLARATSRWEAGRGRGPGELHTVVADMTETRLGARFGLVIIALNTLLLLADADRQLAALRTAAAHLAPDGRLVVDVWLPSPDDLAIYDGRLLLEWQRQDDATGQMVAKYASATFDTATAIVTLTQLFDAWDLPIGPVTRVARTDRLRLLSAAELTHLAEAAGVTVEHLAGDYRMGALGPGDERAILIGRLV
jgi:SAM-dependent methyltransferase